MRLSSFFASCAWRSKAVAFLTAACAATACESVPSFSYEDGGADDATVPVVDSGGPGGDDGGGIAPDGGTVEEGGTEAGDDGGTDSGPTTTACLPPMPAPPPDAGCCSATQSCVGLACVNCGDCENKKCPMGQYCCAQLKPNGDYKAIVCSPNGMGCP